MKLLFADHWMLNSRSPPQFGFELGVSTGRLFGASTRDRVSAVDPALCLDHRNRTPKPGNAVRENYCKFSASSATPSVLRPSHCTPRQRDSQRSGCW